MVARILAIIIAVQLAALGLFWYLAARWLPPDWALVAALAAVLAVRLAITANNFRMARRRRSAPPQPFVLNLQQRLRMFFYEYASTMMTSSWWMLHHRPRMHLASPAAGVPVLLVHGYGCNGGYFAPLARALERAGISHATVDLEPMTAAIDDYAVQIDSAVRALCAASGAPRVAIVAHSMGGLVARAYLRRFGADRLARVVTLGTPHFGTGLASFGVGHNARQMQRGAEWLADLDRSDHGQRALFTSIYSHHDNIIAPQDSSYLPGARNLPFGGIGHVALGRHPAIIQCVLAEIKSIP